MTKEPLIIKVIFTFVLVLFQLLPISASLLLLALDFRKFHSLRTKRYTIINGIATPFLFVLMPALDSIFILVYGPLLFFLIMSVVAQAVVVLEQKPLDLASESEGAPKLINKDR